MAKVDESEFVYLSPCEASAASGNPGCKQAPGCLRAKPIGEAERGLTVQAVLAYEPEFPAIGPVTITPLLGMDYVVDLMPVVDFVAQKDREREFEQRRHKCLKCVEKSLAFCESSPIHESGLGGTFGGPTVVAMSRVPKAAARVAIASPMCP